MTLQQLFPNLDLSRITDAGYLSQFAHPDQATGGYQLRGADGELYDLNSTLSNEEGGLGQLLGLQNGSINVTHHYGQGDTGGGQYYEFGRDGNQIAGRDYKNYTHNVRDAVGMSAMVLAPILGGAMLGAGAGAGSGSAEAGMSVGNGAFLGEGAASGVGAWDGALTAAQAGGVAGGAGAMGASAGGGAAGAGEGVGGAGGFVGEGAASGVPAWDGASGASIGGMGPGGSSLSAKFGSSLGGLGGGSSDGLAGAAVKYGAPIIGGLISSNAAGKAANTQAAATDRANALLGAQYNTTRSDLAPWRDSGVKANNALVSAMGLGPNDGSAGYGSLTKQFTGADLQNEPGYQFGLTQGQHAIDSKAAAGGSYFSGNALKAAARYGNDYAGTKYGEAFARDQSTKGQQYGFLSGMSTQGQNAANMTGQFGAATTGAIAGNTTALGNAQGAAQIAQGNALSNAMGSVSNSYSQDNMLQQILASQERQRQTTGGNYNGISR